MTHCREGVILREKFFQDHAEDVVDVARAMAVCLARGGKILFCGNGGSAADAQHLAAEFVGRFQLERPPLPAIALTTDTSVLTATGNDYGFDQIFSKQVQALGARGDILVGISTSGNSPNVLRAFRVGRDKGLVCVSMGGQGGGEMAPMAAHNLLVPGKVTALIQEVHIAIGHMLCNLVDFFLFEAVTELQPYLEEA
jgi:D-sedoheptulose 7-phosphate isomerase